MKILIIGSGAREHAIAEKILQNPKVTKIYTSPYSICHKFLEKTENINLKNVEEILLFAKENQIDLTIVGSEELLVEGIVDAFEKEGLRIFGPNKESAQLEGSKVFAKDFMKKYGVKTAKYEKFFDEETAIKYLAEVSYPVVVKYSGLAAGKGVVIAQNYEEAKAAIVDMLTNKVFSSKDEGIVIEEYLAGVEASILSITDSNTIIPFISAKDHKKIGEGETGLNTGGMGVIAPNPYFTKKVEENFIKDILEPTLKGIKDEKMNFAGIIFFGLMICKEDVYLLEYNMRMGDPETQALLPLMKSDYLDVILKALDRDLQDTQIKWSNKTACCVVAASQGYPTQYEKGIKIDGLENLKDIEDVKLFVAGVDYKENSFVTNGGRVLNVVALAEDLEAARKLAYKNLEKISFSSKYYRKDIGLNIDDKKYELDRIRSGSGKMFTDGKLNLGIKGNEAYIEIDNKISNYEVEGQATKDYAKSIKY